ncbi:MAG: DUF131 domain-containing protein [Candidatus Thermoplasmatota archaeon]
MNYRLLSLIFFICGIGFFIWGIIEGDVEAGFFVIFPFVKGSGLYSLAGFICIFLSIVLFMMSFIQGYKTIPTSDEDFKNSEKTKSSFKGGGLIMIGPIPIVFGSNWKIAVFLMVLGLVIMLVSYFLFF